MRTFVALLLVGLLLPLPSAAVANDVINRQLAAAAVENPSIGQQSAASRAANDYRRKSAAHRRQLRALNALSGAFGGLTVGWGGASLGLTATSAGALVVGAGAIVTGYAVRSFLDASTRRFLLETRRENPVVFDALMESAPGAVPAELVAQALQSSWLMAQGPESGALVQHGYDVASHLMRTDLGQFSGIARMTADELSRELESFDRENYVEAVGRVHDLRTDLKDLAEDADAVNQQILDQVRDAQSEQDDGTPPDEEFDGSRSPAIVDQPATRQVWSWIAGEERAEAESDSDRQLRDDAQRLLVRTQNFAVASEAMAGALVATGVLNPADASRVQNGLGAVVGVATTVAQMNLNPVLAVAGAANAITTVARLFADPEPRAEMALLGELLAGQQRLLQGQLDIRRDIAEAHSAVLEGQVAVLEALHELDGRMAARFQTLGEAIDEVQWELGQLAYLIGEYSVLRQQLNSCATFIDTREQQYSDEFRPGRRGYRAVETSQLPVGTFATWQALQLHFENFGARWSHCMGAMETLFSTETRREIHAALLLAPYPSSNSGGTMLTRYVNPGVVPLVDFVNRHYPLRGGEAATGTFCALLNAPLSYEGIDFRGYGRRCAGSGAIDPFATLHAPEGNLAASRWLLRTDAVVYFIKILLEVLPYHQLRDPAGGLLAAVDVAFGEPRWPRGGELVAIEAAYRLVSVAIAQQVLLTGDIFLPLVHQYLFSAEADPEERAAMVEVLRHNPFVAQNYLVMQLRRELHLRNGDDGFVENMERYERIYEADNGSATSESASESDGYRVLFASYWEFSPDGNGVLLRSGSESEEQLRIALPTPEELEAGVYRTSREYSDLVRLRSEIIDYVHRNGLGVFRGRDLVGGDGFVWY